MTTTQIALLTLMMLMTGAVGAITGGNSLINVPHDDHHRDAAQAGGGDQHVRRHLHDHVGDGAVRARRRAALAPPRSRSGVITLITSALGAVIAVKLPETVVKLVVGISMGVLVAFIALHHPKAPPPPTAARRTAGYVGATLLGVYGGFFSGGYTTLMTVLCTVCFGLTMMESVAVTKPVNLVSCVAASVVFFTGGIIDLRVGLPLAAANLVGGWLGAHAALKGGDRFVRRLFLLTVAALAVKLVIWDVLLRP